MRCAFLALCALAALPATAQPLQVYSELAKVDARGKVTAPEFPREILSPALVRNGFTSFQVVVEASDSTSWELFVAQNPDEAVTVTLYRIVFEEGGDKLERVEQGVRGIGTQVFWMDLWADRSYTVSRIKVEPQLHIDGDWAIYPIEARVMTAQVPMGQSASSPQLCGAGSGTAPAIGTPAALRYRNAAQDRALAAGAPPEELQKALAACAGNANPEAYLRVRDYLFRRQGGA